MKPRRFQCPPGNASAPKALSPPNLSGQTVALWGAAWSCRGADRHHHANPLRAVTVYDATANRAAPEWADPTNVQSIVEAAPAPAPDYPGTTPAKPLPVKSEYV